jgi:hypothetical protein
VSYRIRVTAPVPFGTWGDVCPEPAINGTKLRHLGRATSVTTVGVAVSAGGQNGRQAFAADPREVPT